MNWQKIALVGLSVGCFIAAALLPAVSQYLVPLGTALVGWVLPAPGAKS